MDTNKMREQFEVWWEDNKHFMLGTRKVSKGDCFHIWQASREAVAVELPPLGHPATCDDESWHHTRNSTIDACKRMIEAQGFRVKS